MIVSDTNLTDSNRINKASPPYSLYRTILLAVGENIEKDKKFLSLFHGIEQEVNM